MYSLQGLWSQVGWGSLAISHPVASWWQYLALYWQQGSSKPRMPLQPCIKHLCTPAAPSLPSHACLPACLLQAREQLRVVTVVCANRAYAILKVELARERITPRWGQRRRCSKQVRQRCRQCSSGLTQQ
jgi:hypothetical protein